MTLGTRLAAGTSLGLATGLVEVAILAFRQSQGTWANTGPHIAWMSPVADALLFTAVALLLARLPWMWTARALTFLAVWTVMLAAPGISPIAGAVLAAGAATQAARWVARDPNRIAAAVRVSAVRGACLVVLVGMTIFGWEWNTERAALAALPPAPAGVPNVLLVVLDTVRADALALYGYSRPTSPSLARLAQRAVVFDHALATASWTLPSHASMFTGRMPGELSTGWLAPLDATYPTLAEALGDRGYATAGFVANLLYTGSESGLDRGFARYEDYRVTLLELVRSCGVARFVATHPRFRRATGLYQRLEAKSAEDLNAALLRWIDGTERPFFAFLNYFDAHSPYLPPAEFAARFGSGSASRDPLKADGWVFTTDVLTPPEIAAERDAYDAAIAYLDEQLGALFGALERRGALDRTIVIVTADHGEQFGEHDLMQHGNSLYPAVLRVPLLIAYPGRVPAGVRIAEPVSLRDIPASVMQLTGAGSSPFPGESLARYWRPLEQPRAAAVPVFAELEKSHIVHRPGMPNSDGRLQAVVAGGVHYIRESNGREELYDVAADPGARVNLIGSAAGQQMIERVRAMVLAAR